MLINIKSIMLILNFCFVSVPYFLQHGKYEVVANKICPPTTKFISRINRGRINRKTKTMKTKEEILNFAKWRSFNLSDYAQEAILAAMDEYAAQGKWVSVKDILPELSERYKYLVCVNGIPQEYTCKFTQEGVFYKKGDAFRVNGVTQWQPIPTAPTV